MSIRRFVPATLIVSLACLAGCYYPGGPGGSFDRQTYESTTWAPKTITLEDTRTGQTVWSVDVPVGKELVCDFHPDEGTKDGNTPDRMSWKIFDIGTRYGTLDNSLPVPPKSARLLKMSLRPVPELPQDMSGTPAKAPATPLPDSQPKK